MNRLNTEKLIGLVRNNPELYDGRHKDHADLNKREMIWQLIAKELGVQAELCKAKWNILRGGYRRALRNSKIGNRKWRFEDDLSFLRESVMERRRQKKNERQSKENLGSENEEEFTIVKEEPTDMMLETLSGTIPDDEWISTCGSLPPASEPEVIKIQQVSTNYEQKEYSSSVEIDSIRQFFLSLAETVKTLPRVVQVQVKAEVFKAVNTAELNFLLEKNSCTCQKNGTL